LFECGISAVRAWVGRRATVAAALTIRMAPALSPRKILLAASFALLVPALAAAPAHALEIAPPEPHSPNAEGIHSAYWVTIVIVVALIVAINAGLLAALIRFRERRGREPSRFVAGRGALRPILAALTVFALVVFVYGVIVTDDVRTIEESGPNGLESAQTAQVGIKGAPPASLLEGQESTTGEEPESDAEPTETSPLEIDAIAQQWLWRFEYPGGRPGQRTFSYGELVVPVDTTVILNVTSTDVLHSWWVPALGGQVQAAPGEVTQTGFKADEVGRYPGRSTIFSGSAYPTMRSWVRVVDVPEYLDHVEGLQEDLAAAQGVVAEEEGEQPTADASEDGSP
jgi:cytochrome c oxidase subunit II